MKPNPQRRALWLRRIVGGLSLLCLTIPRVGADAPPRSWRLATDDTVLTIGVVRQQLVVEQLRAARSRRDWVKVATPVPLMSMVWIGGQEIRPAWTFVRARRDRAAGTLTLAFTNVEPPLSLRSIWRAWAGHGPIEHRVEIENQASQRLAISHQDSLALTALHPDGPARAWWIKRGGSNASTQGGTFSEAVTPQLELNLVSNCEDGASPVPWLAIQVGAAHGLYVGWEFSGLGRIAAQSVESGDAVALRVGNLPEFKTDLAPGETFQVPPAFVGCYTGDLDEGSYTLHRWVIEKLRPPVPKGLADPTLAYNLYLDAGGANALEADVLRCATFCRDLGFETFMPDAMWFPECGDWRWDPRRFPRGSEPIRSFVHQNGMRFALWCAWSNGGLSEHPEALSVRGPVGHPDWFNADYAPDWKPGPFYGAQLCLGCLEAREWAIRKTQALVGEHQLDYLKHDISPIVTRCNKATHRHRYGVDASYWAAMGYYEVQERLRRAYPNLVLENCSGGGHVKDYGAMARTHYVVTTDTLSNLPDRQSLYDSTFALPPLTLQAYTYEREYHVPGDEPGPFLWRSAMMGAWQIDPTNTRLWTEAERASARRAVTLYREWVRPLLPDAKVHHVLPRPDGVHWDGLFYWSAARRYGLLFVFRPDSGNGEQVVHFKGLAAHQRYRIWCEDGSVDPGTHRGEQLMVRGLTLRLPERYTSDLVFVQEASRPAPKDLVALGEFRLLGIQTEGNAFTTSARLTWEPSAAARSYRVTLAESADLFRPLRVESIVATNLVLTGLPANRRLFLGVEAQAWGGRRLQAGGPGEFDTPAARDLSGVRFVSDLPWVRATAGADNPVRRDTNYFGQPIHVGARTCLKGVWTHAFNDATPADVAVEVSDLPVGGFAADVGVESGAGGGSVQFQVLVDGVLRTETPVLRPGQMQSVRTDVTGAREVILRVLNGGDGYACDHAAWGWARFIRIGADDPLADR